MFTRPGAASVLYVRTVTRTGLLCAVRTGGAGQLAPRRHALHLPLTVARQAVLTPTLPLARHWPARQSAAGHLQEDVQGIRRGG